MATLIDGYNLLHATGIFGRGVGPGTLERSRNALLNVLAESIETNEISSTTVVFDASDPPPGLPRLVEHRGITVYYASQHEDADALIEELIEADHAPRSLVVVSSDHRLQRAARRRKATAIDSDRWYGELLRQRRRRQQETPPAGKPERLPSSDEVQYWLEQFGLETPGESPDSFGPFPPGYGEDLLEDET